jgi:hypothetical protein
MDIDVKRTATHGYGEARMWRSTDVAKHGCGEARAARWKRHIFCILDFTAQM